MEETGRMEENCGKGVRSKGGSKGLGGISEKMIGMEEKLAKERKRVKKIEGTEEEVGKLRKKGKRKTMDAKVEDGGN